MSSKQLTHFEEILVSWQRELMYEVDRTVHHMQDEAANFPDPNDRATQESEFGLELRTRDRERKLLRKIDSALARIEGGRYGFCDETGEEIGLKRLEARPVATLCVEAQERDLKRALSRPCVWKHRSVGRWLSASFAIGTIATARSRSRP